MLKYKLYKKPYDEETVFTGKLTRELKPGITVLVGCNGSGKTTILRTLEQTYSHDDNIKVFKWDGRVDKSKTKDTALLRQNYNILAMLSFSSEGEEISLNMGLLVNSIGSFVKDNQENDILILLDGVDSGLSVDNIVELKSFFHELLFPDMEKTGQECYVVISANEYELTLGETCIDARSGKEVRFKDYDEYRKFILDSRKKKDERGKTRL